MCIMQEGMKNIYKYPEIMKLIEYSSPASSSRKLEAYLRKEIIVSFVSKENQKDILDTGCGWGVLSVYLALNGHKVTSLDYDQCQLEHTKTLAKDFRASIAFLLCDAQNLNLPSESFDLVIWEEMLEHLTDPLSALKEGCRVLRPQGKIILSVPNLNSLRAKIFHLFGLTTDPSPEHRYYFNKDSISELVMKAGFRIISIKSDFIPIPKLPIPFFLEKRKAIAQKYPNLGHHMIIYAQK